MVEAHEHHIEKAKRGDAEAFGILYRAHVAQIYRFIVLKVSTKQEAEDLTHEVFVSAWRTIGTYAKRGHPFSSWLYQIARNKVIDHYRVKKSHASLETMDPDALKHISGIAESIDATFELETIHRAIQILPEEQQTIIALRFVEDLSLKEIARILGKSEGSIRVAQHRALQELKKLLTTQQ